MTARLPLEEAADRLDQLVRAVKEKQLGATGVQNGPLPPSPPSGLAPDSAWDQRYAARSLRPQHPETPATPEYHVAVSPPPSLPVLRVPAQAADDGPIGAVLGKPGKRRSLLARLFGRGKT